MPGNRHWKKTEDLHWTLVVHKGGLSCRKCNKGTEMWNFRRQKVSNNGQTKLSQEYDWWIFQSFLETWKKWTAPRSDQADFQIIGGYEFGVETNLFLYIIHQLLWNNIFLSRARSKMAVQKDGKKFLIFFNICLSKISEIKLRICHWH